MSFFKNKPFIYAKLYKKAIEKDEPLYDENEQFVKDERGNILTEKKTEYVYGWVFQDEPFEKNFIKIKTMTKLDEFKIMKIAKEIKKELDKLEAQSKEKSKDETGDKSRSENIDYSGLNLEHIENLDNFFSEKCDFSNSNIMPDITFMQLLYQGWAENSKLTDEECDFLV